MPVSYGYYESDKKRMTAKKLHEKIETVAQQEVARQESKFIKAMLDELEIQLTSHTFYI